MVCCGNVAPPTSSLFCRTRGGTPSLCGYLEYTSPSVPPVSYLTKSFSGAHYQHVWNGWDCVDSTRCLITATYSGACDWSPGANVNCVLKSNGSELYTIVPSANFPCTGGNTLANVCTIANLGYFDYILTPTTRSVDYSAIANLCSNSQAGHGSLNHDTPATAKETLSNPDTEANAISRFFAVFPNFGSWASSVKCQSNYEARTNTVFAYREAQWMVNVAAANTTNYTLSLEVWRAPYSFTNYALFAYANTSFATNGTGFASVTGNVAITLGYTTYVSNANVY